MKIRLFKSIDGFFRSNLKYKIIDNFKDINFKKISLIGKGNSISGLPYSKKSTLLKINTKKKILLDKRKKIIEVSGNYEAYNVHNFLLKNNFFFPSFPSYPNVTIGACIANCTHGISPKFGIISDYVKEIKLYNPNFGFKILTKKKNKKIFDLTIGGLGLTGIIISVKLKVFKLKSTFIQIDENKKFTNLSSIYKFLKNKNFIYNQNNLFFNFEKKYFITSRLSSGNFHGNRKLFKKLDNKPISFFRFGILKFIFFRFILEKLLFFKEYIFKNRKKHINDSFYPSNARLIYFNLMPDKFMEHQVIIPNKNIEKFFSEFYELFRLYRPTITLGHLKIFRGNGKYLQFNGNGLGLTLHFIINKNFKIFYNQFLKLNLKYSCKPNLYKNSFLDIGHVKQFYKKNYKKFNKEIKLINKKYFFENRLFNINNFYK